MFIIRRILLYLNPLYFVLGLELIRVRITMWWLFLVLGIIILLFTVWDFTKRKIDKRFLNFSLAPIVLFLSTFTFLLFVDDGLVYHVTAVISGLFMFLFLEQIMNYFYFSLKYQPYTLESFSFYTNLLSVFYLSASLFAGIIFLRFNRFALALVGLIFIGFIAYQVFWVNKIDWAKSSIFVFTLPLLFAEIFLAISFLPTSYYVNGFIVTVLSYLIIGLSRLFLLEDITRKNVIQYLVIGGLAITAILATAQWV